MWASGCSQQFFLHSKLPRMGMLQKTARAAALTMNMIIMTITITTASNFRMVFPAEWTDLTITGSSRLAACLTSILVSKADYLQG